MQRSNQRIQKRYLEEKAFLKELPERKTTDYTEERIRVTSSSTIYVRKVLYSVPSRLIGNIIKVHIYDDRLECFVDSDLALTLTRKRVLNGKHVKCIDYRHLISSLRKKHQAFRNYIYKEEMFPTFAFKQIWEFLDSSLSDRKAFCEYVGILKVAAEANQESIVNEYLESCIRNGILPSEDSVRKLFSERSFQDIEVQILSDNLSSYEQLLSKGGHI